MRPPEPKQILKILEQLDWTGHIELGHNDLQWLAQALAAKLDPSKDMCAACGMMCELIVRTPLGPMCESCIEDASDEADATRELYEEMSK